MTAMNTSGIAVVLIGAWLLVQVIGGDALRRLRVLA